MSDTKLALAKVLARKPGTRLWLPPKKKASQA